MSFSCGVLHSTNLRELHFQSITEAYHLEAYNSEPMLGFFSQPIKIYFLIWSVGQCTSRYLSNGGQICCFRVLSRLSFLDLFLRSSRESSESFLGAASQGHIFSKSQLQVRFFFLYQNKFENRAMLKMFC